MLDAMALRWWVAAALALPIVIAPRLVRADTLEGQLAAQARMYDEPWFDMVGVFEKMFVCADLPAEHYKRQVISAEAVLSWIPGWAPALLDLVQAQVQLGTLDQASKSLEKIEQTFKRSGPTDVLRRAVLARRGQLETALKPGNYGGDYGSTIFEVTRLIEHLQASKPGIPPTKSYRSPELTAAQRSEDVFGARMEGNYHPQYDDLAWLLAIYGDPIAPHVYFALAEQLVLDKSPLLALMAYEQARKHGHPAGDRLPGYAGLKRGVEKSGQLERARAALLELRRKLLAPSIGPDPSTSKRPGQVEMTCQRWFGPGAIWWQSYEDTTAPEREAFTASVELVAKLYDDLRDRCGELPAAVAKHRREHAAQLTVSYALVYAAAQRDSKTMHRLHRAAARIADVAASCARAKHP
jgi:hypothetical protein